MKGLIVKGSSLTYQGEHLNAIIFNKNTKLKKPNKTHKKTIKPNKTHKKITNPPSWFFIYKEMRFSQLCLYRPLPVHTWV
jgi:hypothetical protein